MRRMSSSGLRRIDTVVVDGLGPGMGREDVKGGEQRCIYGSGSGGVLVRLYIWEGWVGVWGVIPLAS